MVEKYEVPSKYTVDYITTGVCFVIKDKFDSGHRNTTGFASNMLEY